MVKKLLLEENYDSQDSYKKSDCVDSHRYGMQKSIFIELSFLALFLMPWQKAYSYFFFFNLEWS